MTEDYMSDFLAHALWNEADALLNVEDSVAELKRLQRSVSNFIQDYIDMASGEKP